MLIFALFACTELPFVGDYEMEDNSLEATGVQGSTDGLEAEGPASVAAEAAEGDWSIAVEGVEVVWHSASRADLSILDGRDLRLEVDENGGQVGDARLLEDGAPVLVASVGDGAEVFGREVWTFGASIGGGVVVNEYDEATRVVFHEAVIHADDGDVVLLPGEPTPVVLDGATFRATVIAAYRIEPTGGDEQAGCGPSDLLSVELLRTETTVEEAPLTRPAERLAPMSSCG